MMGPMPGLQWSSQLRGKRAGTASDDVRVDLMVALDGGWTPDASSGWSSRLRSTDTGSGGGAVTGSGGGEGGREGGAGGGGGGGGGDVAGGGDGASETGCVEEINPDALKSGSSFSPPGTAAAATGVECWPPVSTTALQIGLDGTTFGTGCTFSGATAFGTTTGWRCC